MLVYLRKAYPSWPQNPPVMQQSGIRAVPILGFWYGLSVHRPSSGIEFHLEMNHFL